MSTDRDLELHDITPQNNPSGLNPSTDLADTDLADVEESEAHALLRALIRGVHRVGPEEDTNTLLRGWGTETLTQHWNQVLSRLLAARSMCVYGELAMRDEVDLFFDENGVLVPLTNSHTGEAEASDRRNRQRELRDRHAELSSTAEEGEAQ